MSGVRLFCPYPAQCAGQWAIGTALGLYFTPAVLTIVASFAGYIAAGVVFAMLLGVVEQPRPDRRRGILENLGRHCIALI